MREKIVFSLVVILLVLVGLAAANALHHDGPMNSAEACGDAYRDNPDVRAQYGCDNEPFNARTWAEEQDRQAR